MTDSLFTAPQTIPGQIAMSTDAAMSDARVADARVAAAPNFASAMEVVEGALNAGVPIADLLAEQALRMGH